MARDLQVDQDGNLVIDPDTHDLAMVSGLDEIGSRRHLKSATVKWSILIQKWVPIIPTF